jgi:hypothetical protein
MAARAGDAYEVAPPTSHMTAESAGREPPTPARPGQKVRHDLACAACGYNLRGLAAKGLCPECATPIRHSLTHSGALSLPAETVRQIGRGGLTLQVSILAALAAGAVVALLGTVGHAAGMVLSFEGAMAIVMLPGLGVLAGTWMIAASPPREPDATLPVAPASAGARLLCIGALVTPPLLLLNQPTAFGPGVAAIGPWLLPIGGLALVPVLMLAAMIVAAVSARSTADRLGSPEVAADCWEAKVWGLTNIVPLALFVLTIVAGVPQLLVLVAPLALVTLGGFLGYFASMAGSLRNRCKELRQTLGGKVQGGAAGVSGYGGRRRR